jgi:hypothetical protein
MVTECKNDLTTSVLQGDCLDVMRGMSTDSVDLVFCSPPYEAARTYGIDFNLKGQQWVDWAKARYFECVRVSRGLVAWVVEGQTRNFRWSATPVLLMSDLHRAGVKLRKPPAFRRAGIPGSGGPDWLRNDYEFIICSSKGRLPWSDNTAMGHPPKWAPGGEMSYRNSKGTRRNHSHKGSCYSAPKKTNPGNVIKCNVGGGLMGSRLAHENEAPFPEQLAEFFVRSFCPPNGIVLDPFCGSGTTMAVAKKNNRQSIGIELRESQIELSERRIKEVDEAN